MYISHLFLDFLLIPFLFSELEVNYVDMYLYKIVEDSTKNNEGKWVGEECEEQKKELPFSPPHHGVVGSKVLNHQKIYRSAMLS